MTHEEQVLQNALENLIYRIEHGQDTLLALTAVCYLYGVRFEDLQSAYDKHNSVSI